MSDPESLIQPTIIDVLNRPPTLDSDDGLVYDLSAEELLGDKKAQAKAIIQRAHGIFPSGKVDSARLIIVTNTNENESRGIIQQINDELTKSYLEPLPPGSMVVPMRVPMIGGRYFVVFPQ